MESMFAYATTFNGDISKWDTSRVEDMAGMFGEATSFNGDLSIWDTSSVTSMASMFHGATTFNGDLSNWNTSSVGDDEYEYMFQDATSFNQDLCVWRDTFPYGKALKIFEKSNCTFQDYPQLGQRGPFCASSCTEESGPTPRPSSLSTVRL